MVPLEDLERFLGTTVDTLRARRHLDTVEAFARAYTRGRGFTDGNPAPDIAAVIVTAAARLMSNPEGVIFEAVGSYSVRHSVFSGFNLVELSVLNNYRRRAA